MKTEISALFLWNASQESFGFVEFAFQMWIDN
jgi:hypothetical protein